MKTIIVLSVAAFCLAYDNAKQTWPLILAAFTLNIIYHGIQSNARRSKGKGI